jgi:cell wall-associated NlpC family hydrolase
LDLSCPRRGADINRVIPARLAAFVVLALVGGAAASGASAGSRTPFASAEIATVVQAGLMAPSVAEFRPNDPLTEGDLASLLYGLGGGTLPVANPYGRVTLRELDARLVTLAGLRPAARGIRLAALDAGLAPRSWLGTETVARMLELRINHLQKDDDLELEASDPATRAEAAYSVAKYLALDPAQVDSVRTWAETFTLPTLSDWQRQVLARALRFVGSPYVYAGTSEKPQLVLGRQLPGGFDCSGFVWRVFKLEPFARAPALSQVLVGRTTYAMSGEVPRSARLSRDELQAGDVVFFGSRGTRSKPSEVGHMGIYLGNGWIVHSSRFGTTMTPMTGWYETTFAWGRSPLAEAGLE